VFNSSTTKVYLEKTPCNKGKGKVRFQGCIKGSLAGCGLQRGSNPKPTGCEGR